MQPSLPPRYDNRVFNEPNIPNRPKNLNVRSDVHMPRYPDISNPAIPALKKIYDTVQDPRRRMYDGHRADLKALRHYLRQAPATETGKALQIVALSVAAMEEMTVRENQEMPPIYLSGAQPHASTSSGAQELEPPAYGDPTTSDFRPLQNRLVAESTTYSEKLAKLVGRDKLSLATEVFKGQKDAFRLLRHRMDADPTTIPGKLAKLLNNRPAAQLIPSEVRNILNLWLHSLAYVAPKLPSEGVKKNLDAIDTVLTKNTALGDTNRLAIAQKMLLIGHRAPYAFELAHKWITPTISSSTTPNRIFDTAVIYLQQVGLDGTAGMHEQAFDFVIKMAPYLKREPVNQKAQLRQLLNEVRPKVAPGSISFAQAWEATSPERVTVSTGKVLPRRDGPSGT